MSPHSGMCCRRFVRLHVSKSPTTSTASASRRRSSKTAQQPEHEYLYWEFAAYDQQQAVRAGKWKIIRSGVDNGDPPFELYDLSHDIGEQHNVAAENPDVVRRLAELRRRGPHAVEVVPAAGVGEAEE